jgi:methyl-accepting chemotaxis protein
MANNNSRVSWGAILAGVLIALITQITLNILGITIGATVIEPGNAFDSIQSTSALGPGYGQGTAIWIAVSALVSLFLGGYVAAYLAGNADKTDAMLHGLAVWALSTIVSYIIFWLTASSLLTGITGFVSQGFQAIGSTATGVASQVPEVAQAIDLRDQLEVTIQEDLRQLLPDDISSFEQTQLDNAVLNLLRAEAQLIVTPEDSDATADLRQDIDDARTRISNIITEQTDLTTEEINSRLDDYTDEFQQVAQRAEDLLQTATSNISDALATTAGLLFLMMILGAAAGAGGGIAGRPFDMDDTREFSIG